MRQAHEALWGELQGKLLQLPAEFFTFELMYRNHTRHFHEEKGKLTGEPHSHLTLFC